MSGLSFQAKAVLCDIEGTTSSIAFVKEVLFPYARERLDAYLAQHKDEARVADLLRETAELANLDTAEPETAAPVLKDWIDQDKKAPPLKALQGMMWQAGYEAGELKAPIYDDALEALKIWRDRGLRLALYSSGSVEAQKLFFRHNEAGDLTGFFEAMFDTRTGAKTEAASFGAIAEALGLAAGEILFLSDHPGEVAAAREAGMQAVRIDRDTDPEFYRDGANGPVAGSFGPLSVTLAG